MEDEMNMADRVASFGEAAGEEETEEASALRENISRKGVNSYYYAHSKTATGPVWDGKEEPRLLAVEARPAPAASRGAVRPRREFDSYAWSDGKKTVKLIVDFAGAHAVEADRIAVNWTETSVEFLVRSEAGDVDYCLIVQPLNQAISGATHRAKENEFVITVSKAVEASWYQLKKASS